MVDVTEPAPSVQGATSVTSARPLWLSIGRFHQIGFVVPDLTAGIGEFSLALGVELAQWRVFDSGEPFEHHEPAADGRAEVQAVAAIVHYARLQSGPTAYQLLEPVTRGTIWQRWLASGVTQFAAGYFVRDLQAAQSELRQSGAEQLAWGRIKEGDDAFSYSFLRLPRTRAVIELIGAAD